MGEAATKLREGQNPLQFLFQRFGKDIGKFIAIQKVRQLLQQKIHDLKITIQIQSSKIQYKLTTQIANKKTSINDLFQKYRQDIDRIVPGGINKLQQLKNQSIQDLLGLNTFLKKLDQLSNTLYNQINLQISKAFDYIDNIHNQQRDNLISQRPKVPLYDSLPPKQQQTIIEQGSKFFIQQIENNKQMIMNAVGDKLNPDFYLKSLFQIIPPSVLDAIFGNANNQFDSVKKMLISGGIKNIF